MTSDTFSLKAGGGANTPKEDVPFVRDNSDNKLFPEIQVKDIRSLITDDCIGGWDFDGVVYRVASNMENSMIKVVLKGDKEVSDTLPNITTFKGRGKSISESSWLGLKNVERGVMGLPLWSVDDFEVTPLQQLKMAEDKAIEQAKIQIHTKIKQVKQQYGIPSVRLLLGEGKAFRTLYNQCREYKGQRTGERPLLLSQLRKWCLENFDSELAPLSKDNKTYIEADDVSNVYSQKGYQHYLKTGLFNFLELSPDKDALGGGGKLLINPDTHVGENNPLRGKFKFPQAMLIEATHKTAGDVELVVKGNKTTTKELKGWGFKYLIYQAMLGKDQADNYSALSHLGQGLNFGDVEAYQVLKPCKTAKETLQVAVDKVAELLPYGVQYTSHKGEVLDVDVMTYMNEYFKTAYMMRSFSDTEMTLDKLCKAFKVDTSAIVNNNRYTPPEKVYVGNEENILEVGSTIEVILKEKMKGLKSKKKADQAVVLDEIKDLLQGITFESHYEMKQTLKEGFKEEETSLSN